MATVPSMASSATASSSTASSTAASASGTPTAPATIAYRRGVVAIEVRLAFIFEIAATLDRHRRNWRAFAVLNGSSVATAHLGTLLLQNRFAR